MSETFLDYVAASNLKEEEINRIRITLPSGVVERIRSEGPDAVLKSVDNTTRGKLERIARLVQEKREIERQCVQGVEEGRL